MTVGGHSTSHVDPQGFVWDEGGHVIFSHYPYFDKLIDDMLGKEVHERIRESWVYLKDVCVPYPFQNNLRYLPKPLQVSCLMGAAKAAASRDSEAANFREGTLSTFGEGIAETFMFPYNSKVWTTPLERMSKGWIAERVSVVDFKRLLENVLYEKDDVVWGPNNKFRFPLHGGTGEIYRRMARRFPDKVRTGKQLAEVDTGQRKVSFTDGTGDSYDVLISTAPLDLLAGMLKPADTRLREVFLFEADLLLGPWAAPLRPASCRLRWQEHTNESAPDSSSHGTPVAVRISGLQVETNFSPCYIGCESQLTT
jgi:protoporphyrinogen oxidase